MAKKNKKTDKGITETEEKEVQFEPEKSTTEKESEKDTCSDSKDLRADETDSLENDVEVQELDFSQKYEELNDRYLRLVAEYDNFRKRSQKEKVALYNESVIDVCKAWLPVLDNLDRAIAAAEKLLNEESKKMAEGMEMVKKQALETMRVFDVEEIDCLGESFDPEYHDAVAHVDDDAYGENEIIDVLQKGYIKGDRVIRHSVVRVAN